LRDYPSLKTALSGQVLPQAFIDLEALDHNIAQMKKRSQGFPIRLATKSIRCRWAIRYIMDKLGPQCSGLMCYHPKEACWLAENGFDNLLIAYPYLHSDQMSEVLKWTSLGKKIYVMADNSEQLKILNAAVDGKGLLKVCLDIDMGVKLPLLFFGVYRSSFKEEKQFAEIHQTLKECPNLELTALMGYEAQVAGLGDNNPFHKLLNYPVRLLKKLTTPAIHRRRKRIVEAIQKAGYYLDFVNGGGTGSIESTIKDSSVTEVAVGSGFYSPLLFDYYTNFKHEPAAGFALEVTRRPHVNMLTCAGGGYIASGAADLDKLPRPVLPEGISLIREEGAGEVQTPLLVRGKQRIALGDPIIFRHSKAGELCERFQHLLLIRQDKILEQVPTYRGEGQCYL
jgi:D-serine deaminase-like pyridoxal phosphate-dependent protein